VRAAVEAKSVGIAEAESQTAKQASPSKGGGEPPHSEGVPRIG